MSEVKVYSPIILKPEDSFGKLLEKLYAEGWGINSAEYMQADTLEEAVKLQAKTFPCLEFQPVQLSKPDRLYPYHHEGKWVAFHRTPKPKTPDSYGDWLVYYNSTEKYWFLRNEKTLQDHPKHFDHPPTLEEIKEALGQEKQSISLELGKYTCLKCGFKAETHEEIEKHQCSPKQETPMKESLPNKKGDLPCDKEGFNEEECKNCPDPCTDYCSHGIHKSQKGLDSECENCEDQECEEPDALLDEDGKTHQIIKEAPNIKVSFRNMFSKKPRPAYQVGDTVTTEFGTKGKIIRIETHEQLEGKVYAIQDETGTTELYHETAIKEKETTQKSIDTFFGNQQNP